MFLTVFSKFLPVFLLFLLGNLFRIKSYVSENAVSELKKLVVNVFLPSLLFLSFSRTGIEPKHLIIVVIMFLVCTILLFIGRFFQKLLKVDSKYFYLLFTGFEAGMLGYSLFTVFYGTENVFKFAIIDLGQVTFVFFVLVGILLSIKEGRRSWNFKSMLYSFLKTPVIIAIFLGIIFQKTKLIDIFMKNILLSSILETIEMLSVMTVPFISLIIGYELKFQKENLSLSFKVVILRNVVLIVLGFLINYIVINKMLGLDNIFQRALITMFLLPPPFIIPLYIRDEDREDKVFISNTLALSTLFTMLIFLLMNILGGVTL
ncbi:MULTISPECIES: AEC family transporter [Dictyoglomus]|jgi:predicted permease|uniref:Auxin Efflux Carrier n=1 Tax=Dictyoglomus turgidum (strain DSM 6724 / Z-1310) TaxID=515635 RepID=B8DYY8_DICTD|nr:MULTISPECIES: auxin efflux carrier [Dictyoglomus]ACK41614.1 Auxin Efflux Carrier [Dictyoglomus turgidum DSM 6724]PNV80817.1 MAG: hypothetical protein C0196_00835 [Dictyoglomus turgidum]HBU31997.1 hypothetical protein [Dictyoglomus sp.]